MDEVMKQSAEILSNMFQIQNVFSTNGKKEDVLLIYQCSQTKKKKKKKKLTKKIEWFYIVNHLCLRSLINVM